MRRKDWQKSGHLIGKGEQCRNSGGKCQHLRWRDLILHLTSKLKVYSLQCHVIIDWIKWSRGKDHSISREYNGECYTRNDVISISAYKHIRELSPISYLQMRVSIPIPGCNFVFISLYSIYVICVMQKRQTCKFMSVIPHVRLLMRFTTKQIAPCSDWHKSDGWIQNVMGRIGNVHWKQRILPEVSGQNAVAVIPTSEGFCKALVVGLQKT